MNTGQPTSRLQPKVPASDGGNIPRRYAWPDNSLTVDMGICLEHLGRTMSKKESWYVIICRQGCCLVQLCVGLNCAKGEGGYVSVITVRKRNEVCSSRRINGESSCILFFVIIICALGGSNQALNGSRGTVCRR